jgi:hypothetical protein
LTLSCSEIERAQAQLARGSECDRLVLNGKVQEETGKERRPLLVPLWRRDCTVLIGGEQSPAIVAGEPAQ